MEWTELDPLGNWDLVITDRDGDGDYEPTGSADLRDSRPSYSDANEVESQTLSGAELASLAHNYDRNGNLVQKQVYDGDDVSTWRYRYDAWNRLTSATVEPDGGSEQDRAAYTYNGLHQRATRLADELGDLDGEEDSVTRYYYDGSWRLVEESTEEIATDDFGSSLTQRVWSPHYIDGLIFTQTETVDTTGQDAVPNGDFTDLDTGEVENASFALTDRKYDVIALIDAPHGTGPITLAMKERVRYTPYGVARYSPLGDVNGDGVVDTADLGSIIGGQGDEYDDADYRVDADLNMDGVIDTADLGLYSGSYGDGSASDEGRVSHIGNTIGYSGYVYDEAVDLHLARHRWHDARLGRWVSRDPIGALPGIYTSSVSIPSTPYYHSLAGLNRYEFVESSPILYVDPTGLVLKPVGDRIINNFGNKKYDRKAKRWRYKKGADLNGRKVGGRFVRARARDVAKAVLGGVASTMSVSCALGLVGSGAAYAYYGHGKHLFIDVADGICNELNRNRLLRFACRLGASVAVRRALGCKGGKSRWSQADSPISPEDAPLEEDYYEPGRSGPRDDGRRGRPLGWPGTRLPMPESGPDTSSCDYHITGAEL